MSAGVIVHGATAIAETLIESDTGRRDTAHTLNPVWPLRVVGRARRG